MIAHGFSVDLMVELINAGFAAPHPKRADTMRTSEDGE
jgi:hypothetical protein